MGPFLGAAHDAARAALDAGPDPFTLASCMACIWWIAQSAGPDPELVALAATALAAIPVEVPPDLAKSASWMVLLIAGAGEADLLRALEARGGIVGRALRPGMDVPQLRRPTIRLLRSLCGEEEDGA
jgi:hypothetical protein